MGAQWAKANRALIAHRVLECLNTESREILDIWHNDVRLLDDPAVALIDPIEPLPLRRKHWVHRKGAAPSDLGPIVIPGSRGARSYLVEPRGDGLANGIWS